MSLKPHNISSAEIT